MTVGDFPMRSGAVLAGLVSLCLALCQASAQTHAPWPADWNDWSDPALWVTVGNPGNPNDVHGAGYGSVDYVYNIGKYEVTAGQYTAFLNAVADDDTYGLYSEKMWTDAYGCKIERSGPPGSYTYSVAADWANRPVGFVSFWDACRFVNWLHNGQPTGAQGSNTTENGAYTLNGYTGQGGNDIAREPGAIYFLPSEDEWYKASYHKNDGVTGNYWDFPTSTDRWPSNDLIEPDPGNNANFNQGGGDRTIGSPYWRTEVGEFEHSGSPYGTFDQGGNIWEMVETVVLHAGYRGAWGGAFREYDTWMHADEGTWISGGPAYEDGEIGFRVAMIPEPGTLSLLALAGLAVIRRRRRV